jgi:hypothetical protein
MVRAQIGCLEAKGVSSVVRRHIPNRTGALTKSVPKREQQGDCLHGWLLGGLG